MGCTSGYEWCEGLPVVHSEGEEHYCAFHAPKEKKPADFKELVFERLNRALKKSKMCDMSGAVFPDGFDFSEVNEERKFPEVSFVGAKFGEGAGFGEAKFGDRANFSNAKFGDGTNFREAKFGNGAYFGGAKFGDGADFRETKFGDRAYFWGAEFGDGARFKGAKFGDGARFKGAKFGDGADFTGAEFGGGASFEGAHFVKALFKGKTFYGDAELDGISVEKELRLKDVDLSKVLFGGAELRNIHFETCSWQEDTGEGRIKIADEEDLNREEDKGTKALKPPRKWWAKHMKPLSEEEEARFRHVEDIYRILKQKHKERHDEYRASMFHASEKTMLARRTRINNPFYWLALRLYGFSNGFGENPWRALKVLLFLLFLAFLSFGTVGMGPDGNEGEGTRYLLDVKTTPKGAYNIQIAFKNLPELFVSTLEHLSFQKDITLKPVGTCGRALRLLFIIITSVQAALFIFALRNRFRR